MSNTFNNTNYRPKGFHFTKNRLWNRLFLLNFVKFLETNFSIEPIHGAAVGLSFVNARKTSTKELV